MAFFTGSFPFLPFLKYVYNLFTRKRVLDITIAATKLATSWVATPFPGESKNERRKRELAAYGLMTLCVVLKFLHTELERIDDNAPELLMFIRHRVGMFHYIEGDAMGNPVIYYKWIKQLAALLSLTTPLISSIFNYEIVHESNFTYGTEPVHISTGVQPKLQASDSADMPISSSQNRFKDFLTGSHASGAV
ncbi:hypothetical protein POM88_047340 [Heracleum sosnowskyi]|uniref:Uncharacterized protein n=1 Tax=Heracleum sosnowskyi TaxID=360622 RepID=A0AAD8GTB0_9APIA|nr:hypothetical protein POM88_047340 [Heracleum sosnowskyi]